VSARLVQRPGPPAGLVIRGARVLDPAAGIDRVGDLVVRDGRIGGPADGLEVVDGAGRLVIPGLVDPHVHLRVPGAEYKEDIATGTRAAAAGGFVTVLTMPNTAPVIDSTAVLGALFETAESEAVVRVGVICAITVGQEGRALTEHAELAAMGAAALSDDGFPVRSARIMRLALQYQHAAGLPLVLHEEDPELSGPGVMHEGDASARLGLAAIPGVSEALAVGRDAQLAAYEGGHIHICHVSSRHTVDVIRLAKERGVRITAEVSPHHLCLTDADVEADLDPARHKMNPPLRSEEDRRALIRAVVDGTLDCVATDHAPHAEHEKEVPFDEAPFGVTGLETAFAACHTELVLGGTMTLETLVRRMSADPARVLGLPVPTLAPGAVADLVLVDPAASEVVGARGFQSRSSNSAFAGRTLTGRVLMTLAGGTVAYR
jgi:dihydroorotase